MKATSKEGFAFEEHILQIRFENNLEKGLIFTIKSNVFGLKPWRFFEWSLTQTFKYNGKVSI